MGSGASSERSPKRESWEGLMEVVSTSGMLLEDGDVEIGDLLAEGTQGYIHVGKYKGKDVAVKVIQVHTPSECVCFIREALILATVDSDYVTKLYGLILQHKAQRFMIVMELMGRSLSQWIYHDRGYIHPDSTERMREILSHACSVAKGIQTLHSCPTPVIHRDIKPTNIFFCRKGQIKLGDFGLARFYECNEETSQMTGGTGTFEYMAPEVIRCEEYGDRVDVYSFGILLIELLSGVRPYTDQYLLPCHAARGVASGKIKPSKPAGLHPELDAFISLCIHEDPLNRPCINSVVKKMESLMAMLDDGEALMMFKSSWYDGIAQYFRRQNPVLQDQKPGLQNGAIASPATTFFGRLNKMK